MPRQHTIWHHQDCACTLWVVVNTCSWLREMYVWTFEILLSFFRCRFTFRMHQAALCLISAWQPFLCWPEISPVKVKLEWCSFRVPFVSTCHVSWCNRPEYREYMREQRWFQICIWLRSYTKHTFALEPFYTYDQELRKNYQGFLGYWFRIKISWGTVLSVV